MSKTIIKTDNAPAAIGPYSQAVKVGDLLFCSGQIPLDPKTGKMIEGGIKEATIRVLENLKAVIEAGGSSLSKVAKVTIFIKDMNDYAVVNEIYATYFTTDPPARAVVEVSRLPKDAPIEMEAIAVI